MNFLKKAATWTSSVIRYTLSFALGFILFFQLLFISFFIFYNAPAVSDFLKSKLNNTLRLFHLEAEASNISLKPNGTIEATDFSLSLKGTSSLLFACKKIALRPDFPKLLLGKLEIDNANIDSGTLYCPASISPTGVQETILRDIRATVSFKRSGIQIDSLALKLFSAPVLSDGILTIPLPPKLSEKESEKTSGESATTEASWLNQYSLWLKKSFAIKQYLDLFDTASLILDPLVQDKKKSHLATTFFGNGFKPNPNVIINDIIARTEIAIGEDFAIAPEIYAKAKKILWQDHFSADQAEGIVTLASTGTLPEAPRQLQLSARNLTILGKSTLPFCEANVSFKRLPRVTADFQAADNQEWLQGTLVYDMVRQTTKISAKGNFNPTSPSILALFPNAEQSNQVFFNQVPFCAVELELSKRFQFKKARAWINAKDVILYRTPFSSLYARGNITPQKLFLDTLYLKTPQSHAKASYLHDFKTGNYQAFAKGQLHPSDINEWMGPWWQTMWSEFSFLKEQPYADIEVRGNWNAEDEYFTFGKIEGTNFIFRNVFAHLCRLTLQANPYYTSVSKLKLKTPTGDANAHLFWKYKPNLDPTYERLTYDIKSQLLLPDLANLLGKEANALIQPFHCPKPPIVHIKGHYTFPLETYSQQNNIYVYFFSPTPFTYHNVALDHLRFKANYDDLTIKITPIDFGFSGGRGNAKATVSTEADNRKRVFYDVQVENASFDKTLENLSALKGTKEPARAEKPFGGELSGIFTGNGYLGDLNSYWGEGVLQLRNANLGRIRLLGLLSEVLDIPPFHFGNFDLSEGDTMFRLQERVLYFNHTRIYGESARIQANGTYNIVNDQIYFLMDIFPTAELKIPVVSQALAVINPLSNFFQVELTNTLADPKWSLRLTPFGLFKKKTKF